MSQPPEPFFQLPEGLLNYVDFKRIRGIVQEQLLQSDAWFTGIVRGQLLDLEAGKVFTYPEKRAFLYMLNIRVTVNPAGVVPRYTITAGKNGEVRLPLRDCDSIMPMI